MSTHSYAPADIHALTLSKAVELALPGDKFNLSVSPSEAVFTFTPDISGAKVTTLASTVSTHKAAGATRALAKEKASKFAEIDGRTSELIADGFSHGGETLSLSASARDSWLGLKLDKAAVVYPVVINSLDDSTTISIADTAAVDALFTAARQKRREHIDSGRALKDSIRAATTLAEVRAVADSR